MAGEHSDIAFLTHGIEGMIHPTEALDVVRIHAHPDTHSCFAYPDVIGCQIALEIEALEDRVIAIQQTGKAVGPQGDLVKRLGHLIEAVDYQVDLAALDVQKADVGRGHDIEGQPRCEFTELL